IRKVTVIMLPRPDALAYASIVFEANKAYTEELIHGAKPLEFQVIIVDITEDCKLTIGLGSGSVIFWSREDDKDALKSLSEIKFT
ncbi:hypothetical protein Tco_0752418, partial [Tanacetum coccineum]